MPVAPLQQRHLLARILNGKLLGSVGIWLLWASGCQPVARLECMCDQLFYFEVAQLLRHVEETEVCRHGTGTTEHGQVPDHNPFLNQWKRSKRWGLIGAYLPHSIHPFIQIWKKTDITNKDPREN